MDHSRYARGKSYITILTLVACVSIFCNLVISIIFWLNMAAFLCALSSDIYRKTNRVTDLYNLETIPVSSNYVTQKSGKRKLGLLKSVCLSTQNKFKNNDSCSPGGVLRITSDGKDRRIFWGFNFRLRGCLGRKIWQVFFRWFDLSRDF